MDEITFEDETYVRDLLLTVADDTAPPARISIARALRRGRRSRRARRIYLPGAAPLAAAAAVALIAVLVVTVGNRPAAHPDHPVRPATHELMRVPPFSPYVPYVSFGWLPDGFAALGLAQYQGADWPLTLSAQAPAADGRAVVLRLYPAGLCRIGGPTVLRAVRYPYQLSCDGYPVVARVAPLDGAPAYRGVDGELIWEYGKNAWAELNPTKVPAVIHRDASALLRSWYTTLPNPANPAEIMWHQSAASWNLLRAIAVRLRFNPKPVRVVYGFTISGLPANWRAGAPDGLAQVGGRVTAGWQAGPSDDPTALEVSVMPASTGQPGCNFVDGQSSYVTLDGAAAVLRTIDQPYKHWQKLCAQNVDGLALYLTLDLNVPGTNDTPLPGGSQVGGLMTVFARLHLLGTNPATWSTRPTGPTRRTRPTR